MKLSLILLTTCLVNAQAPSDDVVLKAMSDELTRSLQIRVPGANPYPPYYIEYGAERTNTFNVSATLGGLVRSSSTQSFTPRLFLRVGSPKLDNTNSVYTDRQVAGGYDGGQWAYDAGYDLIRQQYWLATDRVYKSAVEALNRKTADLKDVNQSEPLNEFAAAKPVVKILPEVVYKVDESKWRSKVVEWSKIFLNYPEILHSTVDFDVVADTAYYVNSEGSKNRIPESAFHLRAKTQTQAADGTTIWDYVAICAEQESALSTDAEIRKALLEVAENTKAMSVAKVGEAYTGPVLFEPRAAAQLLAQVFGHELKTSRAPVLPPGRQFAFPQSEWSSRIGARVLPDFFNVKDVPRKFFPDGKPYLGNYDVDLEGLEPEPLSLIEKGVLKTQLYTRQPVRGHEGSNARARFPGEFGAKTAFMSNVEVSVSESKPLSALKAQLIDLTKQRGKTYGILVRKLDYPSAAGGEERQRVSQLSRSQPGAFQFSLPLLIYKVYPDGREELIRGVRFRNLTWRSLRDVMAASSETNLFSYYATSAPLSAGGGGGYMNGVSIEAPGLLFDELELEQPQSDKPRAPVVPPPPYETSN